MEQDPVQVMKAMLRIHHITWWLRSSVGGLMRMFSRPSVTVVEGAVWDNISLINNRKGEDMNWGEEDDKGVMELRKWLRERMMVNMRSVITIQEKVGEFETDLSCRMVTASRADGGLVGEGGGLDLLSGGQGGVQGAGHQHTGGGWDNKHFFIDVWVRNSICCTG